MTTTMRLTGSNTDKEDLSIYRYTSDNLDVRSLRCHLQRCPMARPQAKLLRSTATLP